MEWKTVLEEKKAVRVLSKAETESVYRDAELSGRAIPSRFVPNEEREETKEEKRRRERSERRKAKRFR